MSDDLQAQIRTTVGLTEGGKAALAQIMAARWFSQNFHAFKFGVAYALARGIEPTGDSDGSFGTIWNRGTVDSDGRLAELVSIYSDNPDPWDYIRRLGDAGLRSLASSNAQVGLPSESVVE